MVDDGFECGCKYSVVFDTALHSSEHVLGTRRVGGRLCETSIVLLHAVPDMGLWQTVKQAACSPKRVMFVTDSVKRTSCCDMLSQTCICGRL